MAPLRATAAIIMGALPGASGGNLKVPYIIFIIGSIVAFFLFAAIRYHWGCKTIGYHTSDDGQILSEPANG